MSSRETLAAARDERRKAAQDALKALTDAALKTKTIADFDRALSQVQETVKAYWTAIHIADAAARREGGA